MSFVLTETELWPRDEENRYRIYAVRGRVHEVLATTATAAGIGVTLVTLHADARAAGARLSDQGRIGVLDVMEGTWIVDPWKGGR